MTGCVCICNNVTHTRICPPPSSEDIIITTCVTWYAAERRSLGVICSLAVRVFHDAFAAVKEGTASATCVGSNTTNMKHITPRRHQCSLHSVFAGRIFSDAVKAVKEGCANARQKEMVEKYHRGRKAHGREGGGAGQKKVSTIAMRTLGFAIDLSKIYDKKCADSCRITTAADTWAFALTEIRHDRIPAAILEGRL